MKKKIVQIVDSLDYIRSNCFQHQLHTMLQRECDLTVVEVKNVAIIPSLEGTILSCLKLRTINREVENLEPHLKGRDIYVYEQDPWECFGDDAFCPGSYQKIHDKLSVKAFLNPTKWWSDFINAQGIPSKFVKMWSLPEYCSYGLAYAERTVEVGHMGQLHPWRKKALEELDKLGLKVTIVPTTSNYRSYLDRVGTMKMFLHDEAPHFKMGGELIPCNSMWGKEAEVMSQGAFCLRNREEEAVAYGLRGNPLLLEYGSYEELVHVVENQLRKSEVQCQYDVVAGVDAMKNDIGWKSVLEAMNES